jgi:hypothetical protein
LLAKLCKSGWLFLDAQVQRRLRPGGIRTPLEIKQFQPRLVDNIPTSPSGKYEAVVPDASHGSLP